MSLMNQATTPFTVVVSMVLLGTRYSWLELLCVVTVLGAAVLSVFVESSNGTDTNFFWAIFAAATTAFAAASFVLKEKTFNAYLECRENIACLSAPLNQENSSEAQPLTHEPNGR